MILEKDIEKRLVDEVTKRGGIAIKLVKVIGIPDRLILAPLGVCVFVELKKPGEKPRKVQKHWKKKIEALGFDVYVIDSFEGVNQLIGRVF